MKLKKTKIRMSLVEYFTIINNQRKYYSKTKLENVNINDRIIVCEENSKKKLTNRQALIKITNIKYIEDKSIYDKSYCYEYILQKIIR